MHAHALLRRDVDYVVKDGAIEMVDEFKGRIAQDRRWPAGLHTAIEAKEGVASKAQGMILGQITLQHLVALYPQVCGMTGTAATQSLEFRKVYGLEVEYPDQPAGDPRRRPRRRLPDQGRKRTGRFEEIRGRMPRPARLVGTASVEESERLSALLAGRPARGSERAQ